MTAAINTYPHFTGADFRKFASTLKRNGFSPLPIMRGTKRPTLSAWSDKCAEPMNDLEVQAYSHAAGGIAVACSYNRLIMPDIDTNNSGIQELIAGVLPKTPVRKRGKKGISLCFRFEDDEVPSFSLIGKDGERLIDILGDGRLSVIPPTIHPETGAPYGWDDPTATLYNTPVSSLPVLKRAHLAAMERMLQPHLPEPPPWSAEKGQRHVADLSELELRRHRGFAIAGIPKRADEIAKAPSGTRNESVFHAACVFGKYVHHGLINENELVNPIIDSCHSNGLIRDDGMRSVLATIKSGLRYARNDLLPELPDRPREPLTQIREAPPPWVKKASLNVVRPAAFNGNTALRLEDVATDAELEHEAAEDEAAQLGAEIAETEVGSVGKRGTLVAMPGALSSLVERAMNLLVERGVNIFQRGTTLVRPVIGVGIDSQGRKVNVPVLIEVDQAYMRLMLSKYIIWAKPDARIKTESGAPGVRPIDAPEDVAKSIMSNAGNWPFRPLAGIITSPSLRHDGSILSQPGYDPKTSLYLESEVALPPIPNEPTRDEAGQALKLLEGLLGEFPFGSGATGELKEASAAASKSVALSAMLSAVGRNMFPVAPAHGARASTPGTGKSYLFDVVAAVTTGEAACPVISASENEGEFEKRVIGAALSGCQIINADNVNGTLGGDAFCQLIERPICMLRPLGQSQQVRVDNRYLVFFNGNNVHVRGDMTRRVLIAELDAGMEKPAEREFASNPVAKVLADRGKYIAACMTVLRAYIAAGSPKQSIKPMASFEGWSGTVRSALVWLGKADPCKTIAAARAEDPELQNLASFIISVKPHAGGPKMAISVGRLIEIGCKSESRGYSGWAPVYPELYAFLQEFIGPGGRPNPQRVGRWLGRNKGRFIGDNSGGQYVQMRIASVHNSARKSDDWYIETVEGAG